jgi:hypothetical protein
LHEIEPYDEIWRLYYVNASTLWNKG